MSQDSSTVNYINNTIIQNYNNSVSNEDDSKRYNLKDALPFLIIGSIGVILNAFTILVLGSSSHLRKKILNTLIIHQSIIDLICSGSLIGTAHLSYSDPHGLDGILADIYCVVLPGKIIYWTPVLVSTCHLIFMNIERYISIMFPMFHHLHVTRRRVVLVMPFIWAFGIFINTLLQTTTTAVGDVCGIKLNEKNIYYRWYVMLITSLILTFFLPLIIFIGLNSHIYFTLKRQISKMSEIGKNDNKNSQSKRDENLEKATRNIFGLMVIMTLCYCMCWGWNTIYVALWLAGIIKYITGKEAIIFYCLWGDQNCFGYSEGGPFFHRFKGETRIFQ